MNQSQYSKARQTKKVTVIEEAAPQQKQGRTRKRGGRGRGGKGNGQAARQANADVKITNIGRGLRTLGGTVGGIFGQAGIGRMAGAAVSRIFGQGDYITNSVSQNSLVSRSGPPSFGDFTSGFRVKNREYITDISSTADFAYQVFNLNPGLKSTFPWLSTVAANFEEYKFHGAVVYLNTTSGASVASTNTALGLWGVVTQYDPSEPDFTTKQQAENYTGCQSAVPSQSLLHGIECKPRANILDRMYVRTGDIDDPADLKFHDWGKTQVFTSGSQTSNVIGEAWISYDVEFFKPRLPTGGYSAYTDQYYWPTSASMPAPFGSTITLPKNGSNIGSYLDGANNAIVLPASAPPGVYLLAARWYTGTPVTITATTGNYSGSVTGQLAFTTASGSATNHMSTPALGTSDRYFSEMYVLKKVGTANSGTFTMTMTPTFANCQANIMLTLVSPALFPQPVSKQVPKLESNDILALKTLLSEVGLGEILTILKAARPGSKDGKTTLAEDSPLRKASSFSRIEDEHEDTKEG